MPISNACKIVSKSALENSFLFFSHNSLSLEWFQSQTHERETAFVWSVGLELNQMQNSFKAVFYYFCV